MAAGLVPPDLEPAGLMAATRETRIPAVADLDRMRRERTDRVRGLMRDQHIDALVLLGNTNVMYATGVVWPLADQGRANFEQPVAVVLADDPTPHVFSPARTDDRLVADLPADHVHGPVYLDFDEGVDRFAGELSALLPPAATMAIDEWTHPLLRNDYFRANYFAASGTPIDGGRLIGAAKVVKTLDELACMRTALHITEIGIAEVQAQVAPGVRQTDLTATFLRTIFDHGADANILEPMWQVMPLSMSDGPWTTTGDLACPLLATERELVEGDVLWLDTCVTWNGYHSDFGRTWIVGREPDARQQAQFDRWRAITDAVLDVTRAGATGADLTGRAIEVAGGDKPWMPHFYLGHGLGVDSAEMPYVGSDIGEAFDAKLVLQAGMVLVLEPIVWEEGAAGYRAEEVVLITEDGWEPMTSYPYDPYTTN